MKGGRYERRGLSSVSTDGSVMCTRENDERACVCVCVFGRDGRKMAVDTRMVRGTKAKEKPEESGKTGPDIRNEAFPRLTSVGEVAVAFSLNTVGGHGGHQGSVCGGGSLTRAAETRRLRVGGGRGPGLLCGRAPGSVRRLAPDCCGVWPGGGAGARCHERTGGGGRTGGRTGGGCGGSCGGGWRHCCCCCCCCSGTNFTRQQQQ